MRRTFLNNVVSRRIELFLEMCFVRIPWYLLQRCKQVLRDKLRIFPDAEKNIGLAGPQPVQAQEIQALNFRQPLPVGDVSPGIKIGQFEVSKISPETVCPNDGADVPVRKVEGYG